jgi:hypothetical protein
MVRCAGLVLAILFASATIAAAEEKVVSAPFPSTSLDSRASNLFCNAAVGTVLQAWSSADKAVSLAAQKPGLFAKALHGTDKVVLEILDAKLYMFRRDEFESGKTSRDFPLDIIEHSETNLVATATGVLKPKGATVVTLNRKTGLASWTTVMSVGVTSASPRVEAVYLVCGARKD